MAFLYRLLWKHIPQAFGILDERLTGRRLSRSLARTGHYLMNEAHPLVLVWRPLHARLPAAAADLSSQIFFVLLQLIGEILFIPAAWGRLSTGHQVLIPVLVLAPLLLLYLSTTTSSNITSPNHRSSMLAYPYDFALFHPGYFCHTCHRAKPARSKHCPICKACVQKQDHHCIWINNCVGRNNYLWFNLLLVTIAFLLAYGASRGYLLLDARLQERFVPDALTRGSLTAKRWSTRLTWGEYTHCWAWAISVEWRIGAVMMLTMMSFPLALGFLVYHVYLIWAGMTTNESAKWSDWKEDIADGMVFKAQISQLRETYPPLPEDVEPRDHDIKWPTGVRAKWWLVRTREGKQPTVRIKESRTEDDGDDQDRDVPDDRWTLVESIVEVENVYDLGFWDNLLDGLFNRG